MHPWPNEVDRSGTTMLTRHSMEAYEGNEFPRNSSGNARVQSLPLAEPLWTDAFLKRWTWLRAKKRRRGMVRWTSLPISSNAEKTITTTTTNHHHFYFPNGQTTQTFSLYGSDQNDSRVVVLPVTMRTVRCVQYGSYPLPFSVALNFSQRASPPPPPNPPPQSTWAAEEMLYGQHRKMDIPAHARTVS